MAVLLEREIEKVQRKVLALCAEVEKNVALATRAILQRQADWADQVVQSDRAVDKAEIDIEEDCLKIIALHQPVAMDLRRLVALLKINNDLERIGDLAVNIAKRSVRMAKQPMPAEPIDFESMVKRVMEMLRRSIDALVRVDPDEARAVCAADDEVDAMKKTMFGHVERAILSKHDDAMPLLNLYSVARNLERIADHATNIAEDVIYLARGAIVRHDHGGRPRAS